MFEINAFKMTLQKCDFSKLHHLLFGEVIPWENELFLWEDIHSFGAFTTRNLKLHKYSGKDRHRLQTALSSGPGLERSPLL